MSEEKSPNLKYVKLLELSVSNSNLSNLRAAISRAVATKSQCIVLAHNLHSAYLYNTNANFASTYNLADLVLVDGFPILLATKFGMSGTDDRLRITRLGSTDWIPHLNGLGIQSLLVVGGIPKSNEGACLVLRQILGDGVKVEGLSGEKWSDDKELILHDRISAMRPDVILIGLGMPLQERVISDLVQRSTPIKVVAAVGGALDQLSGLQSNSPRWLGKMGLEWLWRFASQPKRLFFRYWVEPFLLARVLVWAKTKRVLDRKARK